MPEESTLHVSTKTQVKVVSDLIENSRLTGNFYIMLVLSTIVVTLGLLLDSAAIIIGGMLITPLLTPILTLSLGVVIADGNLIWRSIRIILKSLGIVLGISIIITFLFGTGETNGEVHSRLISNFPYFLVAFVAGLAATFAWSKSNMSAMMPGVAISVSLLPPLAVVGIGIANLSVEIARGSLVSFLLNLFGILLGSVIIFSLLNFHKSKYTASKLVEKEIKEETEKKVEKKIEKELKVNQLPEELRQELEEEKANVEVENKIEEIEEEIEEKKIENKKESKK